MKKNELEHILRAAGGISECREIIVLGSQVLALIWLLYPGKKKPVA